MTLYHLSCARALISRQLGRRVTYLQAMPPERDRRVIRVPMVWESHELRGRAVIVIRVTVSGPDNGPGGVTVLFPQSEEKASSCASRNVAYEMEDNACQKHT